MLSCYRLIRIVIMFLVAVNAHAAVSDTVVLYDSNGFSDTDVFPAGPLTDTEHNGAHWRPASGTATPGEIVDLPNEASGRALRRRQSGEHTTDTDYLDFPPASKTALTVSFSARVSTTESRTFDMFLLRAGRTAPSDQASVLIWGHEPGCLSYFDGQYRRLTEIDVEWHDYELIHNLQSNTFDVYMDGTLVGAGLPWRNRFAPDTAFGRLRIGGIRGEAGAYADVTNLRISRTPTAPGITVKAPLAKGGLVAPDGGLQFEVADSRRVDAGAIRVMLNGEDASDRLEFDGTPEQVTVTLRGLVPDTAYAAVITAANSHGERTHETSFYTFTDKHVGYRGIWFTLGQLSGTYGDKYSAGSSFAWSHTLTPMAVYADEVDKTFFVYGGVTGPKDRYLLILASYYDHANHRVPRPTIVRDQRGVDDPHDNPSITLDEEGHVWVFVAGRGRRRPGQIFRSMAPYCVDSFEKIASGEQTYSQVWPVPGHGLFHLLTLYTQGRELYWETITDGTQRSEQKKLAGFGGHYQVSRVQGDKVGSAFNYHPGGNVDRRTNLYYAETSDFGETWTTVDGQVLETPLDEVHNPALMVDYEAQDRLVYVLKLLMDADDNPVILYLTSGGFEPGPDNDPRRWMVARWNGSEWLTSEITQSDHNYDAGSLYIHEDRWTLIAPALTGPQPYYTGGEVGLWVSTDEGATWELKRRVTQDSPFNHSYLRRPHNPKDPFYCMWADGDSSAFSMSRLYFTSAAGERLYMLPYTMDEEYAEPILLDPPVPQQP